MTVAELIEQLKQFPPDTEVVYLDAEWGQTDINYVEAAVSRRVVVIS